MENSLTLLINDEIELEIVNFSETIVNLHREELQHPEIYIRIANLETNLSFVNNLIIEKLSLKRNGTVIWNSTNYTTISKLELHINEDS